MSLFETWQALAADADAALRSRIIRYFDPYKEAVCEMLGADAWQFSRLGEYDERAYEHFVQLMDTYSKAVALIESTAEHDTTMNDSADSGPAINVLLAGIYDILQSRLREFEDTAYETPVDNNSISNNLTDVNPDTDSPDTDSPNTISPDTINPDTINPVSAEKSGIIERALIYTVRQIENQAGQFHGKLTPEAWAALRRAFLLANEDEWREYLRTHMNGYAFAEMYVYYQDGLRFCLLGLDDLHARKVARFYTERITREREVLHDLICVQAQALEDAMPEGEGNAVPQHVLYLLREAYQQTGLLTEQLQSLSKTASNRGASPCRPYEAFIQRLDAVAPLSSGRVNIPDGVDTSDKVDINDGATTIDRVGIPDITPFFEALTAATDALFGARRIAFLKAAYRLQRMVGDEILLAEEAGAVFKTTHASLLKDRFETTDLEKQILVGITETLDIKISSLKESIEDFNGETASLLQAFAKEKNDVTDEIKQAAYPAIREAWLTAPPPTEDDIPAFFAQCQTREPFAPVHDEYEKHVARYSDKMEKTAIRFRKEILLYEVSTYEEILTHSVSRLRESASEHVQATAARLEGTYAALEVLLRKNNVIPIRPNPHDPFNGKEHEVLVAEKQEGFEKGEIIKLLGSGYRYKDRILVRANVIAAK